MDFLLLIIACALVFFLVKCVIASKQKNIKKALIFSVYVIVFVVCAVLLIAPYPLDFPDDNSISISAVHDGSSLTFDDVETAEMVGLLRKAQLRRNIFGVSNFVVNDDEYYHMSVNFENTATHIQSQFFHFGVTPAGEILFAYDEHYNAILNPQEIVDYVVNVLSITHHSSI